MWWQVATSVVSGVAGFLSSKKNKPKPRPAPPPPKITYNYISELDRDKMLSNLQSSMGVSLRESLRNVMGIEMAKTGMRLGTSYSRVSDAQSKLIEAFAEKRINFEMDVKKFNQQESSRIDQIETDYRNNLFNLESKNIEAQEKYKAEKNASLVSGITGIFNSLATGLQKQSDRKEENAQSKLNHERTLELAKIVK